MVLHEKVARTRKGPTRQDANLDEMTRMCLLDRRSTKIGFQGLLQGIPQGVLQGSCPVGGLARLPGLGLFLVLPSWQYCPVARLGSPGCAWLASGKTTYRSPRRRKKKLKKLWL
jgi:hypothetical protein